MKQYKVPQRFYQDHLSRDLGTGKIVAESGNYFIVELDESSYYELLSDAEFYSDSSYVVSQMGNGYLGLSKSAQATVRALEKAGA
jgi:hypothetical protein